MEEIWKDIKNYEGLYQVSNLGRVKTVERVVYYGDRHHTVKEKIKEPSDNGNGYMHISLWKNNKSKQFYIHRLVCEAFWDNPENKPTVNHKDKNTKNNCADNLEWATYSEQEIHKNSFGGYVGTGQPVVVTFNDGNVKEYKSVTKCGKEIGCHRDTVYTILNKQPSKKQKELNIKSIDYKNRR